MLKKENAKKRRFIIPGFGLTFGITITMLSLLILIPLMSVFSCVLQLSPQELLKLITRPNVIQAFATSIGCAFFAALINSVFGLILAWVLVRYDFPGRKLIDGMIELPFALPTAVAGITLTKIYSDNGFLGKGFGYLGIKTAYSKIGIIIAMIFIGIPFVVRSVQPVLEKLPVSCEEAALMLGASRSMTYRKVIFPEIRPALLTGFGLAFARGIGEYGSVIYISGNSEKNCTQVISYIIMQKLNSGNVDYEGAAALALILLLLSFLMLFTVNMIQCFMNNRTKGGI